MSERVRPTTVISLHLPRVRWALPWEYARNYRLYSVTPGTGARYKGRHNSPFENTARKDKRSKEQYIYENTTLIITKERDHD